MLNEFRSIGYTWDKANKTMRENVETVSSDERGRKLVVQVLNNGQVEDVTGVGLSLYWETKDRHHNGLDNFDLIDAKAGIYELYFTTGMLSNIGDLRANLHLIDSNAGSEGAITSKQFIIEVRRGINTESVESEDSFSALTEALVRVVAIESQEKERQDNEKARKRAEDLRQTQEDTRQTQEKARERGEADRNTKYGEAETARDRKYDSREDERDTKYEAAEKNRERTYDSKETGRDRLYDLAEDRRDAEYGSRLDDVELTTSQTNKVVDIIEESVNNLKSESGSNENGHWIKRADGTMECTQTFKVGGKMTVWNTQYYIYSDPRHWTFPQEFIEPPTVSFSTRNLSYLWTTGEVTEDGVVSITGYRDSGKETAETTLTVTASGRWSKTADGNFFRGTDYPSYWESHLNQKIKKANDLQNKSINAHSFVFVTDMHIDTNDGYSPSLIREVVNELNLQTVINGGDLVRNGVSTPKGETLRQIREVVDSTIPLYNKTMMTMGNHDDNSITQKWAETIQHTELYNTMFKQMGNHSVYGKTGKYHYRDDYFNKVRYIVLDSIDIPYIKSGDGVKYAGIHIFAYRQEQLDWLANVALKTPKDWSVVVTSHTPPYEEGVSAWDRPTNNEEIARGILKAYKNKTTYSAKSKDSVPSEMKVNIEADFRNGGGDVIAWFCGHVHYDNVVKLPEGFPLISVLNDGGKRWLDSPERVSGTITEQAFDIVTINKDERKIYLTRVGAGSDRVVSF